MHEIDPHAYLVDVLQHIDTHPAKDVEQLVPRNRKQRFADNPRRLDLERLAS
jgi:hypothetical protein